MNEYISYLPDAFRKNEESNNYKLLSLDEAAVKMLRENMTEVFESLDIEKATGKTLDFYGEIVNQSRGAMNDIQYRYIIRSKIGRNTVGGDYASTMDAIVTMFKAEYRDIELIEEEAPCKVELKKLPIKILSAAGFTSTQAVQMIEALLPVCVTLVVENFEGTFEFSSKDNEYNENTGMADMEGRFGGMFGMLLGEDGSNPLPL